MISLRWSPVESKSYYIRTSLSLNFHGMFWCSLVSQLQFCLFVYIFLAIVVVLFVCLYICCLQLQICLGVMFRYFHVSFRIVYDEKTAKQRVNKTCFIYTIYSTTLLGTIKPVLICLQHYISVFILKGLFCNDCQGSYGIWKKMK